METFAVGRDVTVLSDPQPVPGIGFLPDVSRNAFDEYAARHAS